MRSRPLGWLAAIPAIALIAAPAAAQAAKPADSGPGRLTLVTVSNPVLSL
jgi:hypothetical protein